jgi:WD40 repeat protein
VTALGFSPDTRLLFAASRSLQLRCWSLEGGGTAALRSFKGHRAPVADLAVDASGGLLATGSADRTVRVWDVDGGFCTHSFSGHRCGGSGCGGHLASLHSATEHSMALKISLLPWSGAQVVAMR